MRPPCIKTVCPDMCSAGGGGDQASIAEGDEELQEILPGDVRWIAGVMKSVRKSLKASVKVEELQQQVDEDDSF